MAAAHDVTALSRHHDIMQVLAGAREGDASGEEDEVERTVFVLVCELDCCLALAGCCVRGRPQTAVSVKSNSLHTCTLMTTCDVMFCIHEPQTNSEASSGREELSFGDSGIVEHFGVPDSSHHTCVTEELVVPRHCALDLAREVLAL